MIQVITALLRVGIMITYPIMLLINFGFALYEKDYETIKAISKQLLVMLIAIIIIIILIA